MPTTQKYLTDNVELASVADAIRQKGGTSAPLEYPDGFIEAIGNIGTQTAVAESDVNFYDYDGTCLYSYNSSDFMNLSALPDNPIHNGLTSQGWNYTLEQAKSEVQNNGACNIGQMYIPEDGKTRIYINIEDDVAESRLNFCVRFTSSEQDNVTIDWGDGTTEIKGTTQATNYEHDYENAGNYIVTLKVNNGSISFDGSSSSSIYGPNDYNHTYRRVFINKIEIGSRVTAIGTYGITRLLNLSYITIPNGITAIGSYGLSYCTTIKHLTIPTSVMSISDNGFYGNSHVHSISLPHGLTSLSDYLFGGNNVLMNINIPSSVSAIGSSTFLACNFLSKVILPSNIHSLGSGVFANANNIKEAHIKAVTPPTISAGTTLFTNYPSDFVIYVPSSEDHSILNAYKTASRWSNFSTIMQEET